MSDGTRESLKLHFFSLSRFHYDSQGRLRTFTSLFELEKWEPFLATFSEIVIYARIEPVKIEDRGHDLVHPRITIVPIPYYNGALDYIRKASSIHRFVSAQVRSSDDFYALWLPNPASLAIAKSVSRLPAPLLTIAIGDPRGVSESLYPGLLGKLLAWQSSRTMRKTVRKADAAVYVTLRTLQELYPTKPGIPTLARSNITFPKLPSGLPINSYREFTGQEVTSLIAVGSQETNYKGHDLLIGAVAELQSEGHKLSLTIVGKGALHERLKQQAAHQDVRNITFLERVGDHNAVALEVAKHDIFLIPSRTEGMPKALLEAMSVGVFALGSTAGGIPEVLDDECVFLAGSVDSLSERLRFFLENPNCIPGAVEGQRRTVTKMKEHHSGNEVLVNFLQDWIGRRKT